MRQHDAGGQAVCREDVPLEAILLYGADDRGMGTWRYRILGPSGRTWDVEIAQVKKDIYSWTLIGDVLRRSGAPSATYSTATEALEAATGFIDRVDRIGR